MIHFTRPRQWFSLRKLFSLPPDKSFLSLWIKNFLTKIYRNILTFAFEVLRVHCKCFFWHQPETCLLENWLCYGSIFFNNVELVQVHKINEVFWAKLYCKWVIFFCQLLKVFETFCEKIWNWKRNSKYEVQIIPYLVQISFLLGLL